MKDARIVGVALTAASDTFSANIILAAQYSLRALTGGLGASTDNGINIKTPW